MAHRAASHDDPAKDIAIRALSFLTHDSTTMERFLQVSGINPSTLSAPGSEGAILAAALDYLMSEEDLLLTFAANSGLDPREVARAHHAMQENGGDRQDQGH